MAKELWFEKKIPGDYRGLAEEYGVSPAMARLLVNRLARVNGVLPDVEDVREYLNPDVGRIYTYEKLPDIKKCVDMLSSAIESNKKIRVIGDYDIDGVCATYILTKGLHKANGKADHAIPHRITDGYGLNDRLIEEAKNAGIDCIITCDNGISAVSQIDLAHKLGMEIIVTDHHEVPYHMLGEDRVEDIPDADAIVDIKRSDSNYGFTEICGAMVAFKVIIALYDRLGIDRREADEFIELAAFASIGDIMPLTDENRPLVAEGLKRLKDTSNPGMKALIRVQGAEGAILRYYHVGFVLGPCINATGRLATADNAYELLNAHNDEEAEKLADLLAAMNNERKEMTERGVKEALNLAGSQEMKDDRVLVIYLPDTHESIAGIIAGRVRESTGKPVFVLTDGENGIKGSGRSIDEYDMHGAMTEAAPLFEKFGGHKLAGGLSLKSGVTPEILRERLNDNCTLTEKDLAVKIYFDMVLPFAYADMALAKDIERLEPFGPGNPKPLFAAKDVKIRDIRIYGKNRNVFKCMASDSPGTSHPAIYFGDADELLRFINASGSLKILYYPEINDFRGERTLQLHIANYC